MIASPGHGLSIDTLALMANGEPVTHPGGFTTEVSADGSTWGNAEVVIEKIISALAEGDVVAETHVGNREVVIFVRLIGQVSGDLPRGEKALASVVGKPAKVVWQPPDAGEPPTVFWVVHSRMRFEFDDFAELDRNRTYALTLSALPWGRSATKTITPAVTAVAPTVVDAGSSTANWTAPGPPGATVSVVSGAVTSTYDPDVLSGAFYGSALRRTAVINTSTSKYIGIDWKSSLPSVHAVVVNQNPYSSETEVRRETLTNGYTRSWYRMADALESVTSIELGTIHPASAAASATLSIDQVLLANALPASGTTRQKVSTIFPDGSVPASGEVRVEHATAGLGQTIVYTYPLSNGYSPPLRQWKYAGAADTADAAIVSGAYTPLSQDIWFSIPWDAVPAGDTQLWARLYRNTAATVRLTWNAYASFPGISNAVGDQVSGAVDWNFQATTWTLVPIGRFVSPPSQLGPSGHLRVSVGASLDATVAIDEAWLFAMDKGTLTVVNNLTGTAALGGAANRLRVSAPSLEEPLGALMAGYRSDWADSHTVLSQNLISDQRDHRFHPDGTGIFTVTSGALDAAVSLEHYAAWHSNAGS